MNPLQVTFHYVGYNESGRRIDSSYMQGSPARIRMGTKALVPGKYEKYWSMLSKYEKSKSNFHDGTWGKRIVAETVNLCRIWGRDSRYETWWKEKNNYPSRTWTSSEFLRSLFSSFLSLSCTGWSNPQSGLSFWSWIVHDVHGSWSRNPISSQTFLHRSLYCSFHGDSINSMGMVAFANFI